MIAPMPMANHLFVHSFLDWRSTFAMALAFLASLIVIFAVHARGVNVELENSLWWTGLTGDYGQYHLIFSSQQILGVITSWAHWNRKSTHSLIPESILRKLEIFVCLYLYWTTLDPLWHIKTRTITETQSCQDIAGRYTRIRYAWILG